MIPSVPARICYSYFKLAGSFKVSMPHENGSKIQGNSIHLSSVCIVIVTFLAKHRCDNVQNIRFIISDCYSCLDFETFLPLLLWFSLEALPLFGNYFFLLWNEKHTTYILLNFLRMATYGLLIRCQWS